ncbi:MAG: hypothetical protein GY809_07870, partial [Planctomycetes bacterium]|nr:hypothetical protein [Planctomycetota bacterium]
MMKIKQLQTLTLETCCAAIVLSAFLCGCDSQKEDDPKDDSAASMPSSRNTNTPIAGGCTFSSDLHLEVYYTMRVAEEKWEWIGKTPSASPLNIPRCALWLVKPLGRVDMNALAREIATKKIPGLWLDRSTSDADLAHLKALTGLQMLYLAETKITDAGVVHLKGLTELQKLYLSETKITDTGLMHLKGMAELRTLHLANTKITDAGLVHLTGLARLRELELSATAITDAGLAHIVGLTGLQTLYLSCTNITDAGLKHLKGMTGLQRISLTETKITDAGLTHIKGLTGLQKLDLGWNDDITDVGLMHLRG